MSPFLGNLRFREETSRELQGGKERENSRVTRSGGRVRGGAVIQSFTKKKVAGGTIGGGKDFQVFRYFLGVVGKTPGQERH